ncbi:MAG: SH3 domain-containing protein [Candidatus Neomarinimicrobiota bacterium]|jgi:SH3-like domain-containing protein
MIVSLRLIGITFGLTLTILLLTPSAGLATDSTGVEIERLRVVKESLIREGPAPYYKVAETLAPSTIIHSIEKSGDWYLVKTPSGRIGWISAADVILLIEPVKTTAANELTPSAPVSQEPLSPDEIEIITSGFLMTEPSLSGKKIANLVSGLRVKKLATNSEWYKVQLPTGLIGWVNRNLLAISFEPLPSTPSVLRLTLTKNGNLRKNPNLKATVIGTVAKGTTVTILDSTVHWYNVTIDDNQKGWLNRILFENGTGQKTTVSPSKKILQRNGNLRYKPTLKSAIITIVPLQTTVTVLDSLPNWYKVRLPNQTTGWINKLVFNQ